MKNEFKAQIVALANQLNAGAAPECIDSQAIRLINEINLSGIREAEKDELKGQIEEICQAAREGKTVTSYKIKQNFAQNFFAGHPKIAIASVVIASAATFGAIAGFVSGCNNSTNQSEQSETLELEQVISEETENEIELQEESVPNLENVSQKPLASHLLFDVNDNEALIEESAQFIANSRACGLDFASEKWVRKFMDFTYIMGLEEIDPMDYARLKYVGKTTQSIVDNYQECANAIAYDLFSVKPDTLLDYPIADKDSKEILMELQELVAEYNTYIEANDKQSAKKVAEDLENYFLDNFVKQDGRVYTRATYELVARFANIVDEILPNGLSKEITSILSEDLYTCGAKVPVGEKDKSERAQSETSIREMSDDKLAIAREYRYQDFENLPEIEYLTGVELEGKILERVYELDVEFVANPEKFEQTQKTTVIPAKTSTPSVTFSSGVQVSEQTILESGLNPATVTEEVYKATVVKQFEETALKDFEAAAALHRQGSSDAFNDGYNGNAFNPKQNNADYLEGYTWKNYNEGVNSRPKQESKTEFVDTPDQVVESSSITNEQGYVENISSRSDSSSNSNTESSSNTESNSNTESTGNTVFVPVEEGNIIIIDETVIEEDFVDPESYDIVEETTFEENFEEIQNDDVVEEDSIVIETYFEPTAFNTSIISQYKALRNMLDTAIANPTYFVGSGTLALGNEEYVVQKTKC